MSLFDRRRASERFALDPTVRHILTEFARSADRELAAQRLADAVGSLTPAQIEQLTQRLAELSVAQWAVLQQSSSTNVAPPSDHD